MLTSKNIKLRPLKMSDWEKTLEWRNNFAIKRLAMIHPFPITEMVEKNWYENLLTSTSDKTVYFTITKHEDTPIGFVTLNKINYTNKNCGLGIVIGEGNEQGRGYGKEVMDLVINYAFYTLNLRKITLEVTEQNIHAINLYTKLGFIEEGRLKHHYYADGEYLDIIIMSFFRQE